MRIFVANKNEYKEKNHTYWKSGYWLSHFNNFIIDVLLVHVRFEFIINNKYLIAQSRPTRKEPKFGKKCSK